jgi:hypothetical protein
MSLLGRALGLFACLVALALFAGAVYVGIWLMLIGGIVDIVNQCKAPTTDGTVIGIAVVKIIFFELPLALGFWLGIICGGVGLAGLFHSNR